MEISLDNMLHNDFRLPVLPNPSNLEGMATLRTSRSRPTRFQCHTTGTPKAVLSLNNGLNNGCHCLYQPVSRPQSIRPGKGPEQKIFLQE
jgi:hypothetical protein